MMEPVYALHWLLAFGMEGMNKPVYLNLPDALTMRMETYCTFEKYGLYKYALTVQSYRISQAPVAWGGTHADVEPIRTPYVQE